MKSELKIAFLTSADPNLRNSWSGIYFQMFNALKKQFYSVTPLGPVSMNKHCLSLINKINLFTALFLRRRYNVIHNEIAGRYYAAVFKKKLKKTHYDIIFAPSSSTELSFLKTDIPIYYYSDTSFSQIKNYYPFFSNLSKFSERESELIQYRALKRSKFFIHSSNWATDHTIKHYHIESSKAFTVPMGANIDKAPTLSNIAIKIKERKTCHLLFLGVEWYRKGGPIALDTLIALESLGIDAQLTICGCIPPKEFIHPRMIVFPFLNKNEETQNHYFNELLLRSHFLVLPTRAECAGIVFAEASAFGVPSISCDTGGVSSMVEDGKNGYLLDYDASGVQYAQLIKSIFLDIKRYEALVLSSRQKYEQTLNWDIWGKKIKEIILTGQLIND